MITKLKRSASLFVLVFVSLTSVLSLASEDFPKGPDAALTPGALCDSPDAHRYPEQIAYCNRNVDTSEKQEVFEAYDKIGYRTRSLNRRSFKIDHYIPLCMGGANDVKNLWPQHESVYRVTDPLEPVLCEKMAQGVLKQKEAIAYIMEAKANLNKVDEILERVRDL